MLIVWCKVRKYDKYFVPLHLLFKQVDNPRGRCVLRSGHNTYSHYGFVYCYANNDASLSNASFGSRLAFRGEIEFVGSAIQTRLIALAYSQVSEADSLISFLYTSVVYTDRKGEGFEPRQPYMM